MQRLLSWNANHCVKSVICLSAVYSECTRCTSDI